LAVPELQREVIARGIVAQISGVTLWRWLSADALQPWRHRSWIFPRDPHFAEKAGRVLDLYARSWEGTALGPDEFVISADGKPSIQAVSMDLHSGTSGRALGQAQIPRIGPCGLTRSIRHRNCETPH